jgi:AcrR family transcriptional regulator
MIDEPAVAPSQRRRRAPDPRALATRQRILEAANSLMYVRGVNSTSIDDVLEASGTSKSQLYMHFPDKLTLIREVVRFRGQLILEREQGRLERFRTFGALRRWRDALVKANGLHKGAYGCGLGSMASELSDQDEQSRQSLSETFAAWEMLISDGLRRMQKAGSLRAEADPDRLATFLMAALQGGYLLANAAHDVEPMAVALDVALEQVKTFVVDKP